MRARVRIYKHTQTYANALALTYKQINIPICSNTRAHARIHTLTQSHTYKITRAHINCVCVCVCVCTRVSVCILESETVKS